jgi:nitroalkane oxidase
MQRRRVHGVADPRFNPRALMDDELVPFDEQMETIDTIPGPEPTPQVAPVG